MSFDSVADFKNQLIRKALVGTLLVAPYSEDALNTISGATTPYPLTIPPEYESVGKLSKDGAETKNEAEISDIMGWGDYTGPSRRDVEKDTSSLEVTAIETKSRVLSLFDGVDLSGVTAGTNNEIKWDRPALPALLDWRVLLLIKDINKANGLEVYFGIHYPRANFTVNGGQKMAPGEDPINYPMTVTALFDDVEGTAVRKFIAGPGVAGLKTDMGF